MPVDPLAPPPKKAKPARHAKSPAALDTPTPEAVVDPAQEGSEEAFKHFLVAALALGKDKVKPFRANATLLYHRTRASVDVVMAREAEIIHRLPNDDLTDLKSLPSLCLGLVFAALQVTPPGPDTGLAAAQAEASELRRVLLNAASALADASVFTHDAVAKIKKGSGALDRASDLIKLSTLFNSKKAELPGNTAITSEQIARAAVLGASLLTRVKPKGASKKPTPAALAEATDARDRIYSLLATRYEHLWSIGAVLFGYGVDNKVPGLHSRVVVKTVKKRAAKATRFATKATTKATKANDRAAKVKVKPTKKKPA